MIVTYKYYDDRKRRLAIMASPLDSNQTEITIIRCSRKDSFNKKEIRAALEHISKGGEAYLNETRRVKREGEKSSREVIQVPLHPQKFVIENYFKDWRKSFFTWADGNLFKVKRRLVAYDEVYLVGAGKPIKLREDRWNKFIRG